MYEHTCVVRCLGGGGRGENVYLVTVLIVFILANSACVEVPGVCADRRGGVPHLSQKAESTHQQQHIF